MKPRNKSVYCGLVLLTLIVYVPSVEAGPHALTIEKVAGQTALTLDGNAPFYMTENQVSNARLLALPDAEGVAALWDELSANGVQAHFYAISLDGQTFARARRTSHDLALRYTKFDPTELAAVVPLELQARAASELYIVQFETQPLEAYRQELRALGATVWTYVPNHAHVVRMTPAVRAAVAELPWVRWIGRVHPAYKLEEEILNQLATGSSIEPRRYSIMLYERGVDAQRRVCEVIDTLGGFIHGTTPLGFRIEATLSLEQVRALADLDDVMFIDRKGALEIDMDIAREIGGANYIENSLGYTGQGVRGEVADTEVYTNHVEWSAPPIIHVAGASVDHGTSVYGILFAQGVNPQARGLIPDGVGIFAYSSGLLGGGSTRYTHTSELVDPFGPYRAVFQTNSTGDARTFYYTTISAEMDDMLLLYDILICQSQSNAGNQDSRPQAWAKNIVSCGAYYHHNTLTRIDDQWDYSTSAASIGPADDGRIKPDLSHFYDDIFTTTNGGGYTEFGGTSGATPIVAGHFGLMFQMWHEQVFTGFGGQATVFDSRPHMTTAKALLINSAYRYDWMSGGPNGDIDRFKQGWGMPDLEKLYGLRDKIFIIDETDVLTELLTTQHLITIEPGEPNFQATLVYADPMGNVGAAHHRINDLSMRVTSPGGTVYWGNNGLTAGNFSTPGGNSNTIDTVENVFIANPPPGQWSVEVIADEINEDSHLETPEVDADYALVVTGGQGQTVPRPFYIRLLSGPSGLIPPGTITSVEVEIVPDSETIVPGSETLHYRYDGGAYETLMLIAQGDDRFMADLPIVQCGDTPEYYVSAEGDLGTVLTSPANAPASVYSFEVGELTVIMQDNCETDLGWTVENYNLTDGPWDRGIPVNCSRGDPPSDYDGSGQCYLTDNSAADVCNSDVDSGYTWLISPTIDLGDGDAEISYALWYTNNYGADPNNDYFVVWVSNNDGGNWTQVEEFGPSSSSGWSVHSFQVGDYVTPTALVKVRFEASDLSSGSVVEAGIDDFVVSRIGCEGPATAVCCHGYVCYDVNTSDPEDPHRESICLAMGGTYITDATCAASPCDCGGGDYRGDANCLGDGVDAYDIDAFILAVGSVSDWLTQFECDYFCANDINCDGDVNSYDIDWFITCVGSGNCPPCP
ncbi:MAG: S8 family serine peptidase [Planctomycetota bacterium]